jgi:hypothetical protein
VTKSAKSPAATARKRKPAAKKKTRAGKRPARKDEAAFVETVIATGEAARLDERGRLPAGATHKIVEDEAGNAKVVRRRFSIA